MSAPTDRRTPGAVTLSVAEVEALRLAAGTLTEVAGTLSTGATALRHTLTDAADTLTGLLARGANGGPR